MVVFFPITVITILNLLHCPASVMPIPRNLIRLLLRPLINPRVNPVLLCSVILVMLTGARVKTLKLLFQFPDLVEQGRVLQLVFLSAEFDILTLQGFTATGIRTNSRTLLILTFLYCHALNLFSQLCQFPANDRSALTIRE